LLANFTTDPWAGEFSASAESSLGAHIVLAAPTRGFSYARDLCVDSSSARVRSRVDVYIALLPGVGGCRRRVAPRDLLVAARLSGVVQADPHLLTLDAVGDHLYKSLGHTPLVFPAVAVAWIFATSGHPAGSPGPLRGLYLLHHGPAGRPGTPRRQAPPPMDKATYRRSGRRPGRDSRRNLLVRGQVPKGYGDYRQRNQGRREEDVGRPQMCVYETCHGRAYESAQRPRRL